jgi:hypothetical protein
MWSAALLAPCAVTSRLSWSDPLGVEWEIFVVVFACSSGNPICSVPDAVPLSVNLPAAAAAGPPGHQVDCHQVDPQPAVWSWL